MWKSAVKSYFSSFAVGVIVTGQLRGNGTVHIGTVHMTDDAVAILLPPTREKPALFQNGIIPFSLLVVRKCPGTMDGSSTHPP